jgi:hypothetical protein
VSDCCCVCGAETDEPWHEFCPSCFRVEQGWDDEPEPEPERGPWREPRPLAGALSESTVVGLVGLRRRVAELERRVVDLEAALDALTERRSRAA